MESLRRLDHPDYEIIVVDNRPSASAPLELAGARVVQEPRPGTSAARNRGLAEARGEIVAFADDDVEVDRHWLSALTSRFARQPDVAAVTGLVVPRELETPAQIWFEQSGSGPDRGFAPLTFERAGRFGLRRLGLEDGSDELRSLYATGELGLGSNMAFRSSVIRALGGFDEALGPGTASEAGEDLALLLELLQNGHRIAYEPSAIVHHAHRSTLRELERQIHCYGVGFTAMLTALSSPSSRAPGGAGIGPTGVGPIAARSWVGQASASCRRLPTHARPDGAARDAPRPDGVPARPPPTEKLGPVSGAWGPIRVEQIDVERCPDAITRAPGYTSLWALVRERGRPRGMISLPFEENELSREQLMRAIGATPAADRCSPARAA